MTSRNEFCTNLIYLCKLSTQSSSCLPISHDGYYFTTVQDTRRRRADIATQGIVQHVRPLHVDHIFKILTALRLSMRLKLSEAAFQVYVSDMQPSILQLGLFPFTGGYHVLTTRESRLNECEVSYTMLRIVLSERDCGWHQVEIFQGSRRTCRYA